METCDVKLVFKNTPDHGVVAHLRYWYGTMLSQLVTTLVPRWQKDTADTLEGYGATAISEALRGMTQGLHYKLSIVMPPETELDCTTHFGYFDAGRDAVILSLSEPSARDEGISLDELFNVDRVSQQSPGQFYLVFSFADIRGGTIVYNDGDWLPPPEEMTEEQIELIFSEVGMPKPE